MIRRSFLGFAATAIVVAAAACSASAAGAAFASRPSIDSSPATVAAFAAPPARSVSGPAARVAQDSATSIARLADSLHVDARADSLAGSTPARHDRSHRSGDFGGIGLLGAALATKKVKNSRKKTGRPLSIPLILDSHVHVAREDANGKPTTVQHDAGTLVDDTDLTDDEIDELTARRAIRNATQEDLDHLAAADPASAAQTASGDAGGAQITDEE